MRARGPSRAFKLDKSAEETEKSKAVQAATTGYAQLLSDPQEKKVFIKNYSNTNFVNLMVDKRFYLKVERVAKGLGIEPETIVNTAMCLMLKKIEGLVASAECLLH